MDEALTDRAPMGDPVRKQAGGGVDVSVLRGDGVRRISPRRPLDVWPCCWLIRYLFSVAGDEAAEVVLARVVRDWLGVLDVLLSRVK